MTFAIRTIEWLTYCFAWVCVSIFLAWAIGAIWFFELFPHPVGPILSVVTAAVFAVLLIILDRKRMWLSYAGGAITGIWLVTLLQQPSHDRDWDKDQSELAEVSIQLDDVIVRNFRHCTYRTESDFDVDRSDFQFQLSKLRNVWFIIQRFTPGEGLAHVFLTFEIKAENNLPSRYFAVSVEIRREAGESFSPTQGLYRQYELNYIFGDERDLIGVRTVMRPDDRLFMYPVNATPEQVQTLFRSIADRTNQIRERPEFYHTLLNNCMNGILRHTVELTPEEISWMDPRILLPGYSDRFAWEKGIIGSSQQSFEELKVASRIDQKAREFGIRSGFSEAIRKVAN